MVVEALHVNDNAFGVEVIAQVVNKIIEIQVGHGTDTDKMAEAQFFRLDQPRMVLQIAPDWKLPQYLPVEPDKTSS